MGLNNVIVIKGTKYRTDGPDGVMDPVKRVLDEDVEATIVSYEDDMHVYRLADDSVIYVEPADEAGEEMDDDEEAF